MAGNDGKGVDLDLSKVPLRETGMTAYEILLSESQERMLFVIENGHEEEALAIFDKWDLDSAIIGQVTDTPIVRINYEGKEVLNLPINLVVNGALDVKRPTRRPAYLDRVNVLDLTTIADLKNGNDAIKQLLASPNIASKTWVYEQYDHMVRINTLVLPGSDASVIRVQGTEKALALSVDCNSRYCYLDPYHGAQIAVAECSRNIVCSGGIPIGLTNCLNFGNPEKPEIMWQFEQSVLGMGDACAFFDIPVVSGNVSLYNETKGEAIYPTPTVAVVGLLENRDQHMTQWFKHSGDKIALLGFNIEELGGSEYLKILTGRAQGSPPALDLNQEKSVQEFCIQLNQKQLINSAHDCSEGGLAVAVVEACITRPEQTLGATLNLNSSLRNDALMFGETQSRIVVSFSPENEESIQALADSLNTEYSIIGEVGGQDFSVRLNDKEFINEDINTLKSIWTDTLGNYAQKV
jgi:phosphoribosylformylglycinamidine synthase